MGARPRIAAVKPRIQMAYDNNDGRLRGRKLQAARLRIWRANPHCARCGRLVDFPGGFELDHIKAVSTATDKVDINEDANLQVLCIEVSKGGVKTGCHIDKTAEDMGYIKRAEFDSSGRVVW